MQKTRVDQILSVQHSDLSRSYIKKLIKDGNLLVNGKKITSPSFKISEEDKVKLNIPKPKEIKLEPKKIDLDIVFEDKNIIIVNKQAGLTVHPSTSNKTDTLVNALIYHYKGKLSGISGELRPGIVHRLDKDTSGLLVVAKNDKAHQYLSDLFKNRKISKTYTALIAGKLTPKKGQIVAPIFRSKFDRKKMDISSHRKARNAVTNYEVIKYYKNATLVKAFPKTGRTHQIRVHFASIGHPIIGDKIYGNLKLNTEIARLGLKRQFLHASELRFVPLNSKTQKIFKAELPEDLKQVLKDLI